MDRALGGPGSTVCLAAAHLALVIVALWRTRRPLLTGFHVFLGLDALAYGLRPLCNVLTGGYLLYGLPSDLHPGGAPVSFLPPAPVEPAAWAAYNRGLALQLGFAAALVAGYLLVRPPQPLPLSAAADAPARTPGFPPPGRPSPVPGDRGGTGKACRAAARLRVAWLLSLILGTAAVVAMHVLSGGAWLPGRRGGTTVTAAVPYGKILFPLAAIPLAASLPLARTAAAAQALARAARHGAAVDDAADAAGDDGAGDGGAAGGDRDAPFAHRAGPPPARSATAPVPPPGSAIGGGPPTGAHRPRTSWPRAGASRRGIAVGRMSVTTAPGALLFGTLWATTLLLLLYQRGYLLNALVVAAFVDERLRPWTVRRLGALLAVLVLLLAVTRPLAGAIADGLVGVLGGDGGAARGASSAGPAVAPRRQPQVAPSMPACAVPWAGRPNAPARSAGRTTPRPGAWPPGAAPPAHAARGEVPSPLTAWALGAARFVARSPDFDGPDVWVLAQGFTARHGLLGGRTLASIPARLLTPADRSSRCLLTAVDLLNTYRWRQFYWQTRFGFNVSLAQEVYLNFGAVALPVAGGVAGLLAAVADRWLWRRRPAALPSAWEVYAASPLLAAAGLTKEPAATLLWGIAYLLVGAAVHAVAPSPRGRATPPDPGRTAPSGARVVICRSNPVDPDPRVERVARTLARAGYRVTVVGWDREGTGARAEAGAGTGTGTPTGTEPGPDTGTGTGTDTGTGTGTGPGTQRGEGVPVGGRLPDPDSSRPPIHKVLLSAGPPGCRRLGPTGPAPRNPYGNGLRNLPRWLAWQARLLAWLWRHRHAIDVIHACDFDTLLPALIVRGRWTLTRKVVVYDIFDWYADTVRGLPAPVRRCVAALDRRLLALADAVILPDEHRRRQLGRARPRRLAVIYNSPDWDNSPNRGPTAPSRRDRPAPRADGGPRPQGHRPRPQDPRTPPQDPPPTLVSSPSEGQPAAGRPALRLAYVGTLQPGRGLDRVLSLMARHPEWHLDLAGFGPDEPLVRQAAAALPNVTFHGRVAHDRCRQIYSRADVILALYDPDIPNHRYASPNRLFEALALGKPVLVACGTGVDRRVRRHRLGWVVTYGNGAELEAALIDAARWTPAQRRAFARRAQRVFQQRWAWCRMERRLLALYRELILATGARALRELHVGRDRHRYPDPHRNRGYEGHAPPRRTPVPTTRGASRVPRVLIGPKVPPAVRRRVLLWALGQGMAVDLIPDPYDVLVASARWSRLADAPLLRIGPLEPPPTARLVKRLLDVVGSLVLLALFAPAFILIPLLIWLDDRGPVLYRQTRLGLHGRPFTILKFRTMVVDAERATGPVWARQDDPRVTRIGRMLRSTHLDELPQLVNVLRGEMSLVGPRPERPELAARFSLDEPAFRLREAVRPGLVGLAQLFGRYHTVPAVKLAWDLRYMLRGIRPYGGHWIHG